LLSGLLPRRSDVDPVKRDLVVGALAGGGESQLAAMGERDEFAGVAFGLIVEVFR
jgi:hypothetical protein